MIKELKYTKQVMHDVIANHPNDQCLTSSQAVALGQLSPHLTWHHMIWNVRVVSWGQLSQLCPLPSPCVPPATSWWGGEAEKALALCKYCQQ